MTAQQYSLRDRPQTTESEGSQRKRGASPKKALPKGKPLSRRLLQTLLPATLLPLAVASGLSIILTRRAERNDALLALKKQSFLSSQAASVFVEDSFKISQGVMINPAILQALQQASAKAKQTGLADQPIESLEKTFKQTKVLETNAVLNQYLTDVVEAEGLGEIFITERHGLNVAYSNLTSDFVQRDEDWWIHAQKIGHHAEPAEYDESAGQVAISFSSAVRRSGSEEFFGVIKSVVPITALNERIATYVINSISGAQQVQMIDARTGAPFTTITAEEVILDEPTMVGGEALIQLAQTLSSQSGQSTESIDELKQALTQHRQVKLLELERLETKSGQAVLTALLEYDGKNYSLTTAPNMPWVAISSVDTAEINSAGRSLLIVFALTALILGSAVAVLLQRLARQLSQPLQTLTETAQRAALGELNVRAKPQGVLELKILGQGFNSLLEQMQALLNRQKAAAEDQRRQREVLENEVSQLMEDVGEAANGNLSVRAKLSASDVGIVADLFNSVIESLRDIAVRVKQSTGEVSHSLLTNEHQIRSLADEAVEEAQSLQATMMAVEAIDQSIQAVADNASQASALTHDTYETAQAGAQSMEQTTESILELRSTVGETSKTIKRLGESAQKISQAVSLIDEIALKTNLLAVNASVEAARAGELGQGFSAVAEQVGSLAEQSASATKTIARIVTDIQTETQAVVTAIETGTVQVIDSSQRAKVAHRQLEQVLAKSEQINQLMQDISASTEDQTQASTVVTSLMQKAAKASEQRSQASAQMAQAIKATADVAQTLQDSVQQFKVSEE